MTRILFKPGWKVFRGAVTRAMILALVLLLPGCSRVTQENYAKIRIGMEYRAVVALLGEPASCDSVLSATNCTWGGAKHSIDISFVGDKVVFHKGRGL